MKQKINNAYSLAISPILDTDDCDGRYYLGYDGGKIAVHEKNTEIPPRVIAYFPATEDGKIAAERFVDSKNNDPISDELMSFEKE